MGKVSLRSAFALGVVVVHGAGFVPCQPPGARIGSPGSERGGQAAHTAPEATAPAVHAHHAAPAPPPAQAPAHAAHAVADAAIAPARDPAPVATAVRAPCRCGCDRAAPSGLGPLPATGSALHAVTPDVCPVPSFVSLERFRPLAPPSRAIAGIDHVPISRTA